MPDVQGVRVEDEALLAVAHVVADRLQIPREQLVGGLQRLGGQEHGLALPVHFVGAFQARAVAEVDERHAEVELY